MATAVPLRVPLVADSVETCRVMYGRLGLPGALPREGRLDAGLFFEVDETAETGRVTFEALDSIRVNRGEILPYKVVGEQDATTWVYKVVDSPWLADRDRYVSAAYGRSLVDTHEHVVLQLHDEFVEVIAQGLWFDLAPPGHPLGLGPDHPVAPLPEGATTVTGTTAGLTWRATRSARSDEELLAASELASQRLLDLRIDDRPTPTVLWLRTREGRTTTHLAFDIPHHVRAPLHLEGLATLDQVMPHWETYCRQVSEQQRARGHGA